MFECKACAAKDSELKYLRGLVAELMQPGLKRRLDGAPKQSARDEAFEMQQKLDTLYKPSGGRWGMRDYSTVQELPSDEEIREPLKEA